MKLLIIAFSTLALIGCKSSQYEPAYYKDAVLVTVVTDRGKDKTRFIRAMRLKCSNDNAVACASLSLIDDTATIYISEPSNPMTQREAEIMGHECWHAFRGKYHD